jgi:DNA polymerase I-like protein with 3'-5' exonuclease and polymerase domains
MRVNPSEMFTETKDVWLERKSIATKLSGTLKVSRDVNVNSLYNYPMVGTAADVFKMALLDLKNLFLSDFYMSNFIGRI